MDDDCDTDVDENVTRSCGKGACAGGSQTCTAGDWSECSTLGQATEDLVQVRLETEDGDVFAAGLEGFIYGYVERPCCDDPKTASA